LVLLLQRRSGGRQNQKKSRPFFCAIAEIGLSLHSLCERAGEKGGKAAVQKVI
jgi:hypothetical protein